MAESRVDVDCREGGVGDAVGEGVGHAAGGGGEGLRGQGVHLHDCVVGGVVVAQKVEGQQHPHTVMERQIAVRRTNHVGAAGRTVASQQRLTIAHGCGGCRSVREGPERELSEPVVDIGPLAGDHGAVAGRNAHIGSGVERKAGAARQALIDPRPRAGQAGHITPVARFAGRVEGVAWLAGARG